MVKFLLQAGAKQNILDHLGWTAKEHAALRGYLAVAEMLEPWDIDHLSDGPASMAVKPVPGPNVGFQPDQTYVIVNLGVLQYGKKTKAVGFMGSCSEKAMYMNCGLSMEISISDSSSTSHLVELPILKNMVNEPFVFLVSDLNSACIIFKLFRNDGLHTTEGLVGSCAALLESPNDAFGENRESLIRARTIPILKKETSRVMGTVTFTVVIAKPMAHPVSHSLSTHSVPKGGSQLVGHRGTYSYPLHTLRSTNESIRTWSEYSQSHLSPIGREYCRGT